MCRLSEKSRSQFKNGSDEGADKDGFRMPSGKIGLSSKGIGIIMNSSCLAIGKTGTLIDPRKTTWWVPQCTGGGEVRKYLSYWAGMQR